MPKQNKYLKIGFFVSAVFCGGLFVSDWTQASDSITTMTDQQKKDLEKKQDQIDAINAKIKAYKQIIDLKTRQGSTLSDQITTLGAQANKLELEIDQNEKQIEDLEGGIGMLATRIREKEILIAQQKRILSELMRTHYDNYSSGNIAPLFLTSSENLLYFKQDDWTSEVGDKVREMLDSVQTLRDSLSQEKTIIEAKKKEVDTLHAQLSERNDYLESTKENKAQLLAKTQVEAKKYDSLVDDLQKQRDEIEQEINDLEADKLGDLNLSDMPAFKHGLFDYPVKKVVITQKYGKTSFSKNYASGKHNGVDFGVSAGTPIYAPLGGKVVGVGNNGRYAYGKWVAIDHGNGIITLYGHMSSQSVSKGSSLKTGDKIGLSGNTGYSTGPHLHFTVFSSKTFELVKSTKVNNLWIPIGATVNPMNYLP